MQNDIEPLSLDEAYLDVTENLKGMDIATEIAIVRDCRLIQPRAFATALGTRFISWLLLPSLSAWKPGRFESAFLRLASSEFF